MATLIPSEKHWQGAPAGYLPSPSILTRFATESTAGWQAPRNRQLPFDLLMSPWGHSRHFDGPPMTSGLLPETDFLRAGRHVSKVPTAHSCTAANRPVIR